MIQFKEKKIGVLLPFKQISSGVFESSYTTIDQAKTNLLNLLLTMKGERYMQPEFGTNLYKKIFEQNTEDLQDDIETEIKNAISIWLPYIIVFNIEIFYDDQKAYESNKLTIKLSYGITVDAEFFDTITFRINNIA